MNAGIWSGKDPSIGDFVSQDWKDAFVGRIPSSLWTGTVYLRHPVAIVFQMQPPKDAAPELRHSYYLFVALNFQKLIVN